MTINTHEIAALTLEQIAALTREQIAALTREQKQFLLDNLSQQLIENKISLATFQFYFQKLNDKNLILPFMIELNKESDKETFFSILISRVGIDTYFWSGKSEIKDEDFSSIISDLGKLKYPDANHSNEFIETRIIQALTRLSFKNNPAYKHIIDHKPLQKFLPLKLKKNVDDPAFSFLFIEPSQSSHQENSVFTTSPPLTPANLRYEIRKALYEKMKNTLGTKSEILVEYRATLTNLLRSFAPDEKLDLEKNINKFLESIKDQPSYKSVIGKINQELITAIKNLSVYQIQEIKNKTQKSEFEKNLIEKTTLSDVAIQRFEETPEGLKKLYESLKASIIPSAQQSLELNDGENQNIINAMADVIQKLQDSRDNWSSKAEKIKLLQSIQKEYRSNPSEKEIYLQRFIQVAASHRSFFKNSAETKSIKNFKAALSSTLGLESELYQELQARIDSEVNPKSQPGLRT